MAEKKVSVPSLKSEDQKNHLLVRQKLIDAAEGRLVTVVEEFEHAFDIIGKYEKTVTVFGSARLASEHPVSRQAYAVGWALAKEGYAVVTGGGGGVMEAANKGALDAGGDSIGFNIHLPMEQSLNPYTTESYRFEHFFGRKVAMTLDASAYVYAGGGFGTFDELFEVITLIQTGIIPQVPVILLGKDFWGPLDEMIRQTLNDSYHTIDPEDRSLYIITDDIQQVVERINESSLERAREQMFDRAYKLKDRWIAEGKR